MFETRIQGYVYSGPIPPPEIMAKFDEIEPGFANRILTMAEKGQFHRHNMETMVITSRTRLETRGQWFGASIAVAIIAAGVWLIINDKDVWGLAVILADMATLIGLFLYSRKVKKEDLADKQPETRPVRNG